MERVSVVKLCVRRELLEGVRGDVLERRDWCVRGEVLHGTGKSVSRSWMDGRGEVLD